MALPIVSSAPSGGQSPSSEDGSLPPQTPVSPTNTQSMSIQSSEAQNTSQSQSLNPASNTATQAKRKPSRRANTAERRATHNAVERQRRETLNGRFLDLAALLPNLSQIRRPSKSAIVNSSIANIHASRRHRLLASRELRLLKLESDALRGELNEWRDRAGLPRVDEPVRGEGFAMVLSGEIEVLGTGLGEEEEDGQGQYDGFEEGDEELGGPMPTIMDESEDGMVATPPAMAKSSTVFGHNIPASNTTSSDIHIARMMPRTQPASHGGPMIAQVSPTVSFENPAMPALYEPQIPSHFSGVPHIAQQHVTPEADKVATWAANMYSAYNSQLQLQVQRAMLTPPNSAHSATHPSSLASSGAYTDYAYLANLKRQQLLAFQQQQQSQQQTAMAYAVDGDDASSAGSAHSGRERSGSASAGSGYGSPPQLASPVGYDMSTTMSDYSITRRMSSTGLHINTGSWNGRGEEGMDGMIMKQAMSAPIHVNANGGGYGMMI